MTIMLGSTQFSIPKGFQAVIREIELIPGEVIVNNGVNGTNVPIDTKLSFLVESGGIPANSEMIIQMIDGKNPFPLFFVTTEAAIVTVKLSMDQTVFTNAGEGMDVKFLVRGNLLLSDDRPPNFIISNPVHPRGRV